MMNLKHTLRITVLAAAGLLTPASGAHSEEMPVTPYGGYCKDCAAYGSCKAPMPPHAAIQFLRKYYEERGYRLGNITHKGRFMEAEVLKNGRQIDKVIFDRRSGRIRSIL